MPTRYGDLNELLSVFVAQLDAALGDNLCGAYLQGSFALGDADEHSDVDFIVVTHQELSDCEQAAVQRLHALLYERTESWAQHLEGSYIPKHRLRRPDASGAPLFYLDNGARELIWDNHCNTAVVRWSLREHGVTLFGPEPQELVDAVSPEALRSEVRGALRALSEWARDSRARYEGGDRMAFSRWKQPYLVLSGCRILHTLQSGAVTSKRQAGEWALGALEGRWRSLIRRALDDRPDPWQRVHQPADEEAVTRTVEFLEAAVDRLQERG